jgi:hypothetical protein
MAFLMEVERAGVPLLAVLVLVAEIGCVCCAPLLAVLVLVVHAWEFWFWLGQLRPMCHDPCG